jgi:hypothetical protein
MHLGEGQKLGALMFLIVSLGVYGGAMLSHQKPFAESTPPWINQGPGMWAVAVEGERGSQGVYFFPAGTSPEQILKHTGIHGEITLRGGDDQISPEGMALILSTRDGGLVIEDMPAIKRLALGLPIDLNRASPEELALVPGIGEQMAVQIVQMRQLRGGFASVSDLMAVQGIREKKVAGLKKYLMVRTIVP